MRVARESGFGVTGNFIIDPDFTEEDFEAYGISSRLTSSFASVLPSSRRCREPYFEQSKAQLEVLDWNQYDLHHLLWKPRLPVERFFELYCETWRRTVLNAGGRKKWWQWLRQRGSAPHRADGPEFSPAPSS